MTRPPRSRTRRAGTRRAAALLALGLTAPLAACGSGNDSGNVQLTVLAAASLRDAFETAGRAYEREVPGAEVTFSFAGSQELAAQVGQGAPADVLVTADTRTMAALDGETGRPTVVARNHLVIAVAEGNPEKIGGLKDLSDAALGVVLAAPEVPLGRYSRQVLDRQDIPVRPVSQEASARAVLGKVALGEADAGIVYATDARAAADRTDAVAIPEDQNTVNSYSAAALESSRDRDAADAFVEWLSSAQARRILSDAGFRAPGQPGGAAR